MTHTDGKACTMITLILRFLVSRQRARNLNTLCTFIFASLVMTDDAERAFSACTLMMGKLRTRLSDESFRAGLLLRSWHKAGLLPELEEMAQCLRDDDAAVAAKTKRAKRRHIDQEPVGRTPRKKMRTQAGSSDSNV